MEYINKFKYENKIITIVKDSNNNIWFNMHQLGVILDYKNLKNIVKELVNTKHIKYFRNIVKDYKLYPKTPPQVLYIQHTGLCELIVESKKPYVEKEKFLVWITKEVMPSIDCNKMDTKTDTMTMTIDNVIPSIGYKYKNKYNSYIMNSI